MWGSDQKASIDPVGCIKFVRTVRDIEKAMGGFGPREILPSEKKKRSDLKV
jgi:sialic acid synthase SpsE